MMDDIDRQITELERQLRQMNPQLEPLKGLIIRDQIGQLQAIRDRSTMQ